MEAKNKLKMKILEILEDNEPEVIPLDEIKRALKVDESKLSDFQQAVEELKKEGRVRTYIAIA